MDHRDLVKPPQNGDQNGHDRQEIVVSDVDSDLDPNEMLSLHLETRARLFERDPDLVPDSVQNGKRSRNRQTQQNIARSRPSNGELKLQQRLKSLEADVLFDKHEADMRWAERKVELLQEQAERKKFQIQDQSETSGGTQDVRPVSEAAISGSVMADAEEMGKKLLEESADGDTLDMLGPMFDGLTEPASTEQAQDSQSNFPGTIIRNFGKPSGMSPRRILEDACRSRYVDTLCLRRLLQFSESQAD